MKVFRSFKWLVFTLLLVTSESFAQPYPTKPIRLILPFPAGSATDSIVRVIAQPLSQSLKQSIIVENRPGADGSIAASEVMRAPPDGYTLLMATNSPLAAVPTMKKSPPYDPVKDFTPISYFGKYTYLVLVNPSLSVKSLADLIKYAQANPTTLNFATGNTFGLISTSQLMSLWGIKMNHVPYKGEPPALLDLIEGRVQFMFATQTTALPFVQQGRLRALATISHQRLAELPEVPTLTEAGVTRFSILPWAALFGPARMPSEIVATLNKAMVDAVTDTAIRQQLERYAFEPSTSTPQQLADFLQEQLKAWTTTLAEVGIRPE